MAMVSAYGSSHFFRLLTAHIDWFGLRVDNHPALSLHLLDETREVAQ